MPSYGRAGAACCARAAHGNKNKTSPATTKKRMLTRHLRDPDPKSFVYSKLDARLKDSTSFRRSHAPRGNAAPDALRRLTGRRADPRSGCPGRAFPRGAWERE